MSTCASQHARQPKSDRRNGHGERSGAPTTNRKRRFNYQSKKTPRQPIEKDASTTNRKRLLDNQSETAHEPTVGMRASVVCGRLQDSPGEGQVPVVTDRVLPEQVSGEALRRAGFELHVAERPALHHALKRLDAVNIHDRWAWRPTPPRRTPFIASAQYTGEKQYIV